MGSVKAQKPPKKSGNLNGARAKFKKTKKNKNLGKSKSNIEIDNGESISNQHTTNKENSQIGGQPASASDQLSFFLNEFQSANGVRLSSLELSSIKESCILELSPSLDQSVENLGKHMKGAFGSLWKETLYEGQIIEGKIDPGCPSVLIISASALRSIDLLRGLHSLTKSCRAVKLFSKHMKVEEQFGKMMIRHKQNNKAKSDAEYLIARQSDPEFSVVSMLKDRVNFASGTPSRIKKLIDIEALGISRLDVIVFDLHKDVKGYSLFTLPQVRDEFWDLYKRYFHPRLQQGDLKICLYGELPTKQQRVKQKKRT